MMACADQPLLSACDRDPARAPNGPCTPPRAPQSHATVALDALLRFSTDSERPSPAAIPPRPHLLRDESGLLRSHRVDGSLRSLHMDLPPARSIYARPLHGSRTGERSASVDIPAHLAARKRCDDPLTALAHSAADINVLATGAIWLHFRERRTHFYAAANVQALEPSGDGLLSPSAPSLSLLCAAGGADSEQLLQTSMALRAALGSRLPSQPALDGPSPAAVNAAVAAQLRQACKSSGVHRRKLGQRFSRRGSADVVTTSSVT